MNDFESGFQITINNLRNPNFSKAFYFFKNTMNILLELININVSLTHFINF